MADGLLTDMDEPLYQRVKSHVLGRIADGALKPGDRVPSEHELVATLGVSRMTANRALRELTAEGRLTRVPGAGTFVAAPKPAGRMLEIRPIAEEVRARGGQHSARVLALGAESAPPLVADGFDRPVGTRLYHSLLLHLENGRPLQLEDRWVLPEAAPAYVDQDFTRITPSEFLQRVAPVREVEHEVEALLPDVPTRKLLDMEVGEPCLLLRRRTWVDGRVASLALLWYPGSRYRLGGRFTPA